MSKNVREYVCVCVCERESERAKETPIELARDEGKLTDKNRYWSNADVVGCFKRAVHPLATAAALAAVVSSYHTLLRDPDHADKTLMRSTPWNSDVSSDFSSVLKKPTTTISICHRFDCFTGNHYRLLIVFFIHQTL